MGRTLGALALLFAAMADAGVPDAGASAAKPTVAIAYFDYEKSDELDVLKKGLAQMLISDLGAHPSVRLVERARVQELYDELKLAETKKVDPQTAIKLGKLLSARYVLIGGYFVFGGQLQISTRLMDTQTSALIPGPKVRGKPEAFFELEAELAQKLSKLFANQVPAVVRTEASSAPKRPAHCSMAVALKYSKALDAIDRKDPASARKQLEAVVKDEPDFVLAAIDLAQLVK